MAVSHFTPPGASGNRNDAESQLVLTQDKWGVRGEGAGGGGGDHNSPRPEVDALTHCVCVYACASDGFFAHRLRPFFSRKTTTSTITATASRAHY